MKALSTSCETTPLVANQHRYARLYQAVVLRALQDLIQTRRRDEAREWLLSPESDCAFAAAGISRHDIRQLVV